MSTQKITDGMIEVSGQGSQSGSQGGAGGGSKTDPGRSTDPQKQREQQGGRGTGRQDKGSQGGEDENEHGDNVTYPRK